MNECKKIRRKFILVTVWVAFVLFTIYGCTIAYERTLYISTKQETDKIYFNDFLYQIVDKPVNYAIIKTERLPINGYALK